MTINMNNVALQILRQRVVVLPADSFLRSHLKNTFPIYVGKWKYGLMGGNFLCLQLTPLLQINDWHGSSCPECSKIPRYQKSKESMDFCLSTKVNESSCSISSWRWPSWDWRMRMGVFKTIMGRISSHFSLRIRILTSVCSQIFLPQTHV